MDILNEFIAQIITDIKEYFRRLKEGTRLFLLIMPYGCMKSDAIVQCVGKKYNKSMISVLKNVKIKALLQMFGTCFID